MAWEILFYQCLWVTKFCAKFGRSRIPRTARMHNSLIVLQCMWKEPAPLAYRTGLHRKHSPSPTQIWYWWDPSAKPRVKRFTYFELFAKVPISPSCSAARWAPAQECGLTSRTNCRWVIFTQFLIPTQPSADLLMQLLWRRRGIERARAKIFPSIPGSDVPSQGSV